MHQICVINVPESGISVHFTLPPTVLDLKSILRLPLPNDPKMKLNTTTSMGSYVCVTSIPESQISFHFALWVTLFELEAIFRKVHAMTPR